MEISQKKLSEDACFLNVWAADKESSPATAWMVWIHGGSFDNAVRICSLDGSSFAERGVVLVSIKVID